jgi:hypothetical protein
MGVSFHQPLKPMKTAGPLIDNGPAAFSVS